MRLFSKEDVVRKVLDNFCNDHQSSTQCQVVLRYIHVHDLRRNNCRRNESKKQDDKNPNIVYYAGMTDLRKMKAPIAENLESGQTCELYEYFSPKIERRIGKSVTNTVLAICAHISRNILLDDQLNFSKDCGGTLLWKRLLRRDYEGKESGCHELHITLVLLQVLTRCNFVRVDFIT